MIDRTKMIDKVSRKIMKRNNNVGKPRILAYNMLRIHNWEMRKVLKLYK